MNCDIELIEQATALHLAQPGAVQPSEGASTVEVIAGRRHVVLRNVNGILSTFRARADGSLRLLARAPKGLRQ